MATDQGGNYVFHNQYDPWLELTFDPMAIYATEWLPEFGGPGGRDFERSLPAPGGQAGTHLSKIDFCVNADGLLVGFQPTYDSRSGISTGGWVGRGPGSGFFGTGSMTPKPLWVAPHQRISAMVVRRNTVVQNGSSFDLIVGMWFVVLDPTSGDARYSLGGAGASTGTPYIAWVPQSAELCGFRGRAAEAIDAVAPQIERYTPIDNASQF